MTASTIIPSDKGLSNVLMASRRCGAVAITEKSRKPSSDMASVRGIGVAVNVSTSTSVRNAFSASFCRTPKRCSSSRITNPKFLNTTSFWISLCVPIAISTVPSAIPFIASVVSLAERNRENSAIFTGHSAKRSEKFWKCCSANSVVGTKIATCLPAATAMKAARSATSVLPKPTSPQTRRSIGLPDVISAITALMAAA